jgi:ketosteroid isomerase-like protein
MPNDCRINDHSPTWRRRRSVQAGLAVGRRGARLPVVTGVLVLAFMSAGCTASEQDAGDGFSARSVLGVDGQQASSLNDEARLVLTQFQDAVHRNDLDAILGFFSDDFASNEAVGKDAVREWWTRVIETRLVDSLGLDLETAELMVDDKVAEVIYFDQAGELACPNVETPCEGPQSYLDFRLEKDDRGGWLITGIPSER